MEKCSWEGFAIKRSREQRRGEEIVLGKCSREIDGNLEHVRGLENTRYVAPGVGYRGDGKPARQPDSQNIASVSETPV